MTELIDPRHFQTLASLPPEEVTGRTGCTYNATDQVYTVPVWNSMCQVFLQSATADWAPGSSTLHDYFRLFTMHYLLSARDIQSSGEWISEKDMAGGATFFRGPHAIPAHLIVNRVDDSVETFRRICLGHGGIALDMADSAYQFSITDRIEIAVLYWAGDEEFPAEAKLLFDKSLTTHFALDIIFALAVGICEELGKF